MYTMHFDHSHKTAVHTELLQDLYLSVDAKALLPPLFLRQGCLRAVRVG